MPNDSKLAHSHSLQAHAMSRSMQHKQTGVSNTAPHSCNCPQYHSNPRAFLLSCTHALAPRRCYIFPVAATVLLSNGHESRRRLQARTKEGEGEGGQRCLLSLQQMPDEKASL